MNNSLLCAFLACIVIATGQFHDSVFTPGAVYTNIITVSEDYEIHADDHTIIVDQPGVEVTLPDYAGSKGRIIYILNISENEILAVGNIALPPDMSFKRGDDGLIVGFIIRPSEGLRFQNDGEKWHALGRRE